MKLAVAGTLDTSGPTATEMSRPSFAWTGEPNPWADVEEAVNVATNATTIADIRNRRIMSPSFGRPASAATTTPPRPARPVPTQAGARSRRARQSCSRTARASPRRRARTSTRGTRSGAPRSSASGLRRRAERLRPQSGRRLPPARSAQRATPELPIGAREVRLDGVNAHEQLSRDLDVASPRRGELRHPPFGLRQVARSARTKTNARTLRPGSRREEFHPGSLEDALRSGQRIVGLA